MHFTINICITLIPLQYLNIKAQIFIVIKEANEQTSQFIEDGIVAHAQHHQRTCLRIASLYTLLEEPHVTAPKKHFRRVQIPHLTVSRKERTRLQS